MNSIESVYQAMASNRESLKETVDDIRNDVTISPRIRIGMIADANREAQQKHRVLKGRLHEEIGEERARREQKAFQSPPHLASGGAYNYRQAISNLSAQDAKGLHKALRLAVTTGDGVSVRAVGALAFVQKDMGLMQACAAHDKDIAALCDFEQDYGKGQATPRRLALSMQSTAPAEPVEARNNPGASAKGAKDIQAAYDG